MKSDFDPMTLWAVNELKERVKKQREQIIFDDDLEEVKEIKEPESSIESINEIGDVNLVFSQEMYLDEIFSDFQFTTAAEYEDVEDERRLLQGNSNVDLQSIIRSEVRRGDPDTSAPMSKLGFTVSLVDYDVNRLSLKY